MVEDWIEEPDMWTTMGVGRAQDGRDGMFDNKLSIADRIGSLGCWVVVVGCRRRRKDLSEELMSDPSDGDTEVLEPRLLQQGGPVTHAPFSGFSGVRRRAADRGGS